jgi:hypothetical protein
VAGPDDSFSSEIRVNGFTLTNSDKAKENSRRIVACVNACVGIDTEKLESDYKEGFDPWSYIKYLKAKIDILQDAIDEIALAGMSAPLSMAMQEDEVQAWHARRAFEFIRIAAIAKTAQVEVSDD